MSAQPIETPPPWSFWQAGDNRLAVQTVIDGTGLPAPALVARADAVHVNVTSTEDLAHWLYELGGEVRRGIPLDDVSVWTLRTQTPARGTRPPVAIRVHCPVVTGEEVVSELRSVVVS
ncbi:hypothetical protein ACFY40_11360 [Streptomyces sp. NPDC012950]|uniref:hypothetical protein n=1 Tax=Streptomyces sp. NPDC012950 TaxID=3364858 RepID=UPI0036A415EF